MQALSADHARRFLVRRHLLDPPRSLPGTPASVIAVVERLGSLQFDPLAFSGARNHELVLNARIAHHERAHLETLLYAPPAERRLVELYNKSLNILPAHELPFFRAAWARAELRHREGILTAHKETVAAILGRIKKEGPLTSAAFVEHDRAVAWHWAPTREGRAVLEALFETGALGIARRDGNKRYFELIERLFPKALLAARVTPHEAMRHRLLSRFRGVGLMGAVASSELIGSVGTAAERKRITAEFTDEGILVPAQVEGMKHVRYVLGEELPILKATARAPRKSAPREVAFLAPLDPLMWDRRMVHAVFGFDYLWEVYVPAHKRVHGYYVLPILFGDRMVGRIEPRLDRKTGALEIVGIAFERSFEEQASPEFAAALGRALDAHCKFVSASRVQWPKSKSLRTLIDAIP